MTQSSSVLTGTTLIRRHPNLAWRKYGDEMIVVTIRNSRIHKLNTTAALLWEWIGNASLSLEALIQNLVTQFEVKKEQAQADVEKFVQHLLDAGILEIILSRKNG